MAPGGVWLQALPSRSGCSSWSCVHSATRAFAVALVHRIARLFAFFAIVMLPEQARYAGFPFLLFLACVAWFAPPEPAGVATRADRVRPSRAARGAVIVVVLAAQIVATVAIYPSRDDRAVLA